MCNCEEIPREDCVIWYKLYGKWRQFLQFLHLQLIPINIWCSLESYLATWGGGVEEVLLRDSAKLLYYINVLPGQ